MPNSLKQLGVIDRSSGLLCVCRRSINELEKPSENDKGKLRANVFIASDLISNEGEKNRSCTRLEQHVEFIIYCRKFTGVKKSMLTV